MRWLVPMVAPSTDDIQKLENELAFVYACIPACRDKVRLANAEYFRAKKNREEESIALCKKRVDEAKRVLEENIEKRDQLIACLKELQK